mmetsp:Transcript_6137/g.19547  ORF Transcript_6137/g.19547 Transcript_6137/m.19547 type:complete len:207 (-) Transcript_6137:2-622(-)
MRVLSPRMEPPVWDDDGSTANTATLCPCDITCSPNASMSVDFPAPGGPAIPTLNVGSWNRNGSLGSPVSRGAPLDRLNRFSCLASSSTSSSADAAANASAAAAAERACASTCSSSICLRRARTRSSKISAWMRWSSLDDSASVIARLSEKRCDVSTPSTSRSVDSHGCTSSLSIAARAPIAIFRRNGHAPAHAARRRRRAGLAANT